jgi:hypothetical protein
MSSVGTHTMYLPLSQHFKYTTPSAFKNLGAVGHQWLTPVILAKEAETWRISVPSQPHTLRPYLENTQHTRKKGWQVAHVVEPA